MENRNKFLTFVLACIPGVGQMYLGLFKKGIQLLALFLLAEPVLGFIGIHFIADILRIVVWCYAFFDTFEIAKKQDQGQVVPDVEFFFERYTGNQGVSQSQSQSTSQFGGKQLQDNKGFWLICGWVLIVVGIMAILNLTFGDFELYNIIKSYISSYIVPVALVGGGVYLLTRSKKI